ncbi:MAG: hypothetical protein HF973_13180 [Chloroflexi bacterium]|nr:hypothetical protein [Chloroflexota bacterium]
MTEITRTPLETSAALSHKWRTLLLLSLAELLGMAVWFSASAVVPALTDAWRLNDGGRAWLTMSVQIGFVIGAVGSSILNLADRLPARWRYAFMILALGPAVGIWAMMKLRRSPEAVKLANGKG